jgi:hypothetical protein
MEGWSMDPKRVPQRKAWTIKLRDSEGELIRVAARVSSERPTTWARETLLREAAKTVAGQGK